MEPRITIITLGVSDLKRSIEFYEKGLGLPKRPDGEGIVFFELKGTWLALFPRADMITDAPTEEEKRIVSGHFTYNEDLTKKGVHVLVGAHPKQR